jgi:hypothetical protein
MSCKRAVVRHGCGMCCIRSPVVCLLDLFALAVFAAHSLVRFEMT